MNEYLDQREMDALLQETPEVEQEEAGAKAPNGHQVIQPYDLTSPVRLMNGRMPRLENVNHEMARQLRVALSGILRRLVEVTVLQPKTSKFGDFLNSLALPASLHLFRMPPLRGTSLLALEPKLVCALIDTMFGGSGHTEIQSEKRSYTSIESRVILRIANLILEEMSIAWKALKTIKIEYDRGEINPHFAKVVAPSEVVMLIIFEIEIDDARGNITLCMPYATLEPIRAKLYAMTQGELFSVNSNLLRRLQQHLQSFEVEASVEIGKTEMSIGALLQLQIGDIIRLEKDISSELLVKIENIPKFKGLPCKLNQQKALQVTSRIKPGEEIDHE